MTCCKRGTGCPTSYVGAWGPFDIVRLVSWRRLSIGEGVIAPGLRPSCRDIVEFSHLPGCNLSSGAGFGEAFLCRRLLCATGGHAVR